MKKNISMCLIGLIGPISLNAQTPWTLRQCADYAVEHNISIKQRENSCEQSVLQLSTAKNSRLPDLNASATSAISSSEISGGLKEIVLFGMSLILDSPRLSIFSVAVLPRLYFQCGYPHRTFVSNALCSYQPAP